MAIKWIVPDISKDLKEKIRKEAYLTNEIIIRTELLKAQGKYVPGQEYDFTIDESREHGDLFFEEKIAADQNDSIEKMPLSDATDYSTEPKV